jgi:uncharacterized membrane protein YqgA involved in biofilm formation
MTITLKYILQNYEGTLLSLLGFIFVALGIVAMIIARDNLTTDNSNFIASIVCLCIGSTIFILIAIWYIIRHFRKSHYEKSQKVNAYIE